MPPAKVLPRLINRRADVCCRLETPEARDRVLLALFDGAAVPLGEHPVDDRPGSPFNVSRRPERRMLAFRMSVHSSLPDGGADVVDRYVHRVSAGSRILAIEFDS